MLNFIWIAFILVGSLAALAQALQGDLEIFSRVLTGLFDSAKTGFDISIGLVGVMSLWLGIMKVGERGGIIQLFGRALGPFFRRVFPDIPPGHPASGSIVMNVSANMLGLDNAATPLGLKAMRELQEINPKKDTASNPMIMFLVLNTAGITLIPTGVIAIRASLAVKQGLVGFNAADIFLPTLLVTAITLVCALLVVAAVQRIALWRASLLVPQPAIARNNAGQATALVLNKENLVEQRVLETGGTLGDKWLVTSGLADGDRVIIEGLQKAANIIPAKRLWAISRSAINQPIRVYSS